LRSHNNQVCFLVCSGQHIDRLCAAYRAAIRTNRLFVIDIYTAYILRVAAERFPSLPDINTVRNIKILTKGVTAKGHYSSISGNRQFFGAFARDIFRTETMITIDEIMAQPGRYLVKIRHFNDLLERLDHCSVIFSMWTGYLEEPKYRDMKQNSKITFHEIHTSGHAVREDLRRFAAALKPKRLVPIHTEKPVEYESMFDNVTLLCDGETLEI
jgi:ribonuclease J